MAQSTATSSKSLVKCRRFEGKVAIVTASTEGIGFSIARRLAQEGANVVVSSSTQVNVLSAVAKLKSEGLEVTAVACHVGKVDDRKKLLKEVVSKYGKLDILVANAGVGFEAGSMLDDTESNWDEIFEINLKSTYQLIKEFLPLLKESKSPAIVIMSSFIAYKPMSLFGPYSISKTALLALCKTGAEELAAEGVRVNCIAPGVIETKLSRSLHDTEEARNLTLTHIPMQRLGSPDEVAAVAAFLASEDASYVTGETVVAAGGMQARL